MKLTPIYLSRYDHHRLRSIIAASEDAPLLRDLRMELDRAVVLPNHARVSTGVVTMDSHVTLEDQGSGVVDEVVLTLPEHSDPGLGAVSVLDALGTALLGCSAGDVIILKGDDGPRTLKIIRVYQSPVAKAAGAIYVV